MNRTFSILLFLCLSLVASAAAPDPPKLVVVISVDQFRHDYLTRHRSEYSQGIHQLLTEGAVFSNAYLDHFPTVTAIGHASLLTGAPPSLSGIVGNSWYNRAAATSVTSVSDESVKVLGGSGSRGSSPHNLMVSTVGDELKMARDRSKVIGISMKDRAAILTPGRMADAAYWYDPRTGNFISSSYYFDELPDWARQFNEGQAAEKYLGQTWGVDGDPDSPYLELQNEPNPGYYDALRFSPYGNELVEAYAEEAIRAEKLGSGEGTDLLVVSFSSNDHAGHRWGPDSPQIHSLSLETDRIVGKFFRFLEEQIGMERVLVVFTADHGVAPVPEVQKERGMPGGRLRESEVLARLDNELDQRFGDGKWVLSSSGPSPYLNHALAAERKIDLTELRRYGADALQSMPHVMRVYTCEELDSGRTPIDHIDRRVENGYYPQRAADLYFVLDPYWMFSGDGTTHGSPHHYDAHVPLIFLGPGIRPGFYRNNVTINDLAPTLAAILSVETPSGAIGRVLGEALVD